jgi:hypothetical protein
MPNASPVCCTSFIDVVCSFCGEAMSIGGEFKEFAAV